MDTKELLRKNINTAEKEEAMQAIASTPSVAANITRITKSLCVTCRRKVTRKVLNGRKADWKLLCEPCRKIADIELAKIAEAVR